MTEQLRNGPVLVLDDEKNIVTVLTALLQKRGFLVEGFSDPLEALATVKKKRFGAVITDLYMPEMDGMSFLREVHAVQPNLPVVMITAFGTVDSAVDAIKAGAFDYITKPFEQSEIAMVVQKALNTYQWDGGADWQATEFSPLFQGTALQKLRETVDRTAFSPTPVLIIGETGSGKELLAEEIHSRSPRAQGPLMKLNCAAVSATQIDVELFGGAKPGRLELADGGTLFLDEISELPLEYQLKFLDFLETGSFERATADGGAGKVPADVRIIVSSHQDLMDKTRQGEFREELYYKLNVVPLFIPPVRERREDIPQLLRFFLERLSRRLNKTTVQLSPACQRVFAAAYWPGNLRQMEQVLERMLLLSKGSVLEESDISADVLREISAASGDSTRFRAIIKKRTQDLEKDLIERALAEQSGNITRTAEVLGLSRKGLQLKLKELGIK